jgi:hypothetical protein
VNTDFKAIETYYSGYHFRSRLEARWAVFFNTLGVRFEYEKEGYELGAVGKYLPDFYLPDISDGLWVEVKGEQPEYGSEAYTKMGALCRLTQKDGLLVDGEPYLNVLHGKIEDCDDPVEWPMFFRDDVSDQPYIFCLCPWCGRVGVQYDGRGARVCGWKTHHETEAAALDAIRHLGHWRVDDKCYTGADPRIEAAALAARQARFEHGERG